MPMGEYTRQLTAVGTNAPSITITTTATAACIIQNQPTTFSR
jgi:hypothetical protein